MPKFDEKLETIYARDRSAWRQCLEQHHRTSPGIWLIYYKVKSGKASISTVKQLKKPYALVGLIAKSNPWMRIVISSSSPPESQKASGLNSTNSILKNSSSKAG